MLCAGGNLEASEECQVYSCSTLYLVDYKKDLPLWSIPVDIDTLFLYPDTH